MTSDTNVSVKSGEGMNGKRSIRHQCDPGGEPIRFTIFFAVVMMVTAISATAQSPADRLPVAYFPSSQEIAKTVSTIDVPGATGEVLALASLQGLVNRGTPSIYINFPGTRWSMDYYLSQKDVLEEKRYTDPYKMIAEHVAVVKGVVVYDPQKLYTVNVAVNVAGVEDRIIADPKMLPALHELGLTDVLDLRKNNFSSGAEAFGWYMENYYSRQYHGALSNFHYSMPHYYYCDYLVQRRIPTFWLPGKQDEDYEPDLEQQILQMLEKAPPNIPVLGFWPMGNLGYTEYDGVMLAGHYGKFTIANTHAGNYSFHSGVRVDDKVFTQQKANSAPQREYSPEKKYVALIMIESGDAPCYYQFLFMPWQWEDQARGQVPISWGIVPALRYLAPGILRRIYAEATENDYFFCSISGAGYCYPLIGYGNRTAAPQKTMSDYMELTVENMKVLDLQMLGLYSHPNAWSETDDKMVRELVAPYPGIRSVISDMSRIDVLKGKRSGFVNEMTTIHHTATFWLLDEPKEPRSEEHDQLMVDYLIKEIRDNTEDSRFTQVMFLSWHYSPSRLLRVKQVLEQEGYEFVTLRDFDRLYRIAEQQK